MALREQIKWLLFPGLNLHARLRFKLLPNYFGAANTPGERLVLDAGCGNGMLSYQSFLKGNRVLGISIKESEVEKCRSLFNSHLGISRERLTFEFRNLYDIKESDGTYDEIICTEVIEHIARDDEVVRTFYRLLKPGGVLHLCSPNADHPGSHEEHLDDDESGGHVRAGYTIQTYKELLEPAGFEIVDQLGLGGPIRQAFNKRIIRIQEKVGFLPGFVLFLVALPCLVFDPRNPRLPYSLYVKAVKPQDKRD